MGGSGGGRGFPIGDIGELKKLADEELQRAGTERRNVFVSFAQEDLREVNALRAQSANELSDIEFSDWSVKTAYESTNADYIRARIKERIRHSSVAIVYLSTSTKQSTWVAWEVEESLRQPPRL